MAEKPPVGAQFVVAAPTMFYDNGLIVANYLPQHVYWVTDVNAVFVGEAVEKGKAAIVGFSNAPRRPAGVIKTG